MPTANSLHLGVDRPNPKHYPDLLPLRSATRDAHDWKKMASEVFKFTRSETLTDEQVTAKTLLARLKKAAEELGPGDLFLLTYSGHGSLIADELSPRAGDESEDQTWCLHDRQLIDDELFAAFSRFKKGVRVVVVADCCHSGTSIKAPDDASPEELAAAQAQLTAEATLEAEGYLPRRLTRSQSAGVFSNFYGFYTKVLDKLRGRKEPKVRAWVQLFAACQDNQIAYDGKENGRFTEIFKKIIHSGDWRSVRGGWELIEKLRGVYPYPNPNFLAYGDAVAGADSVFPLQLDFQKGSASGARKTAASGAPGNAKIENFKNKKTAAQATPVAVKTGRFEVWIESAAGEPDAAVVQKICPPGLRSASYRGQRALLEFDAKNYASAWDIAHHISQNAENQGLEIYAEPAGGAAFPVEEPEAVTRAAAEGIEYLPQWPPLTLGENPPLGWHLDDQHSQLAAARDHVWAALRSGELTETVRIAHFDSGWDPSIPLLGNNPNINRKLARSFVDYEATANPQAVDWQYGKGEQQGHGIGTLGILAGWKAAPTDADGHNLDYVGAVPFAEVVPMRIADKVVIFDGSYFCDALEYALDLGCEVVTMSMGGKPSPRMARLINRAYEAGVTIVTAAGNCFVRGMAKIGPRAVVYPARFSRVIAACGAAYNGVPYDFDAQARYVQTIKSVDLKFMQGNWGPPSAMRYALAGYTPNIPWVQKEGEKPLKKNGGGTSSATPQVAAAAAIWICKHKKTLREKGYTGTWRQVEAVREALYATADKSFPEWEKYYGNGIIRAMDALNFGVIEVKDDWKAPDCESSWGGMIEMVNLFLKRRRSAEVFSPVRQQALALELADLLSTDADLAELAAEMDFEKMADTELLDRVGEALRASGKGSEALRGIL